MTNMRSEIKKIGVLALVFIVAVAIYFVWARNKDIAQKTDMIYTTMEEATLPVVYTSIFEKKINCLMGYRQEMGQAVSRESLIVLPEDRALSMQINPYGQQITGIQYEIRSLDRKRLVERTKLESWDTQPDVVNIVLPIQNLLKKEQEYLLDLVVTTKNHEIIHYYSRIKWSENPNIEEMLALACDFSAKTFNYEEARSLTTYLETNSAEDNNSLGRVTIRSSFSQLTWAGLEMQPVGSPLITLKEVDGIMCEVQIKYMAMRENEEGSTEHYDVVENFTMKWNEERIYLMNYSRETNQIFEGRNSLFAGKRIMLGITNDDKVRTKKSDSKQFTSYVMNRDLWNYDREAAEAIKVFSFRSGTDDAVRSGYDQHDVKILSVLNNGDIDFIVYGYMNRGNQEGKLGVMLYRYDHSADVIEERFFIPTTQSFEMLQKDMKELSYLSEKGMLYLLIDHAIYGIDLNSNEYMVLANALKEGSYAISKDGKHLAWQNGGRLNAAKEIHLMNLDTGSKQELSDESGGLLRTLGFVGSDFIYGLVHENDAWEVNGRIKEIPMYAIQIIGEEMQVLTRYEKADTYIASVSVKDSRIHLQRIAKLSDREYTVLDEDTLVCNAELEIDELEGIGWFASEDRRKLYFVQMDKEISPSKFSHSIHFTTPKKVSYEASETLELKANAMMEDTVYYAYGDGHFLGASEEFSQAVSMAYDKMGIVVNQNQNILWNRVNRGSLKQIKNPQSIEKSMTLALKDGLLGKISDTGELVLDARGCSLHQVLYFIDRGYPVMALLKDGRYLLISGYDQYNISLYDPQTEQTTKMGQNDAKAFFETQNHDFICALSVE